MSDLDKVDDGDYVSYDTIFLWVTANNHQWISEMTGLSVERVTELYEKQMKAGKHCILEMVTTIRTIEVRSE